MVSDNEMGELERAIETLYGQQNRPWEEVKKARQVFLQSYESSRGTFKDLADRLQAIISDDHATTMLQKMIMDETRKMLKTFSGLSGKDAELLPPFALEIYGVLNRVVFYPMRVTVEDWDKNPDFRQVRFLTVDPQYPSIIPIEAVMIYHKKDDHIATREEICNSIEDYLERQAKKGEIQGGRESPVSAEKRWLYFNLERYGIQISIDHSILTYASGMPFYPKEVLEALQDSMACRKGLKQRSKLWTDSVWEYGCETFYVPQTPDEMVDKIPEKHLSYEGKLRQRSSLGEPLNEQEKADLATINSISKALDNITG